jgi:hypothetical protein
MNLALLRIWSALRHDFASHARAALVVASVVGLLHHMGYLAWLDAMMLQIVGRAQPGAVAQRRANVEPPAVLLLSRTLYESEFQQRSPLDRRKVAHILAQVPLAAAARPSALVLDLDLSDNGSDDGQSVLDEVLRALSVAGVRLVLPLPSPAETRSVIEAKVNWMAQFCSWRAPAAVGQAARWIRFANTELQVHGGRVLQFNPTELTLGVAAHSPKVARAGSLQLSAVDVCERSRPQLELLVTAHVPEAERRLTNLGGTAAELRPFNVSYFAQAAAHIHAIDALGDTPRRVIGATPLAGRVLFIGGSYDDRDRFLTPLDPEGLPVEGVTLHAATYFSMLDPVTVEAGLLAWLIDVGIGIALGYLFHAGWSLHHRARHLRDTRPGWLGYWAPKGSLVGMFALVGALAVLLVWVAATWLYPSNLWISPGPIVLGMFVKLLLTSQHGDHHDSCRGLPAQAKWVDLALIAAVVVANLIFIAIHSHSPDHAERLFEPARELAIPPRQGASS